MSNTESFPFADFENDGVWDDKTQSGPAVHTPLVIKGIIVNSYRIEWLDISEPETNFYAKNHMVAAVTFTTVQVINGKAYQSARISMELDSERKVVEIAAGQRMTPGDHYNPGVYTVALLKYAIPTIRAPHYRTYPVRDGTTIGHLIDKIIANKMHHFIFLPYTEGARWKGCGDHTLHCWVHLVREGDITSEDSLENPGISLSEELCATYDRNGAVAYVRPGRGWWPSYNPVEDSLTPETTFTDRPLTYQLLSSSAGDME